MGSLDQSPLKAPVVDFSGIDPSNPGSERWVAVRGEVMAALEKYSCMEAVAEDITPEMREAVFGGVMKEVFDLSLEEKLYNDSGKPFFAYNKIPQIKYQTVGIHESDTPEGVQRFGDRLWPQGNPKTCEVICSFSKLLSKLDRIVRMMVLESLGVEKYADSLIGSSVYSLRLSEYGAFPEGSKTTCLPVHSDPNMISIVCQHQIEGLEILTKDGHWMVPSRDSITIMTADAFGGWTNGRLEPCMHRATISGNGTRYSVIFGAQSRDGYIIQVPEELVSEDHPLQYKPYKYEEYIKFRYSSNAEKQADRTLKAYCGVDIESEKIST